MAKNVFPVRRRTDNAYAVVNVADDATTVYDGPVLLTGLYVSTALSAHALPIKDGTTTVLTLPASLAAGTNLAFPDVRFNTSLIVDPDNSATGGITLFFRRME